MNTIENMELDLWIRERMHDADQLFAEVDRIYSKIVWRKLNAAERKFIISIKGRILSCKPLTPKQQAWLDAIIKKCERP